MNPLGIHLTLWIGGMFPGPAPRLLMEALHRVMVTHNDEGRSGFRLTFQTGRSGPADLMDYPLLSNPRLKPFNRVVIMVTFKARPRVLMDGIIAHQQLSPGTEPGTSTLTVDGEDVSVMMDLEEKPVPHPAQDETTIARKLIASYHQYHLIPLIISPPTLNPPNLNEYIPTQTATDLEQLKAMARRYGFVFYVEPGSKPLSNVGYWGPPIRPGLPQRALSVNMGPSTNVESINFQHKALEPILVLGKVQDRQTDQSLPVQTFASTRPPLSSQLSFVTQAIVPRKWLRDVGGQSYVEALARAQGITDASTDNAVTVTGELDALRYGDLLQPRRLVGLRGAGYSHDGTYYVKSVEHSIQRGSYRQSFTLTRGGLGTLVPLVVP